MRSREISSLLVQLVQDAATPEMNPGNDMEHRNDDIEDRIAKEVQIAAGTNLSPQTILGLGEFTPFTCPECHGSLIRIVEGKLSHFRCHTGHSFSEDALLETVMESTGEMLWQVTRGLQEGQLLLEHMGHHS